jgi:quercetin dioxygenase-like cupin family protein
MKTQSIAANIDSGSIYYVNRSEKSAELQWVQHPNFKGVYLKHLIKGDDTDGRFSSHLVKIDPDCCLETHSHENQLELHEIIEGDGVFHLNQETFEYQPGKMAVIPMAENHRVQAGKQGLTLLAKFFPALV